MLGPLGARSRAAADAYAAVLIPILLYVVHSHSSRRCDIEKLYYPLSVHPVFYPILLEHPAASRPTNSRAGLRCCPSPAAAPPPACAAQTRTQGGTARAESTARLPRHLGEAATRRPLQLTDAAPGIPELPHRAAELTGGSVAVVKKPRARDSSELPPPRALAGPRACSRRQIGGTRPPLPTKLEHPAASRPTNSRTGRHGCPSPTAAPPPACERRDPSALRWRVCESCVQTPIAALARAWKFLDCFSLYFQSKLLCSSTFKSTY